MSGVFVCIVGPSGAGKDTLIDGARRRLRGDERFLFPRRIVTRSASHAEDHDTITMEDFRALELGNRFSLSWTAHGLGYGLPGDVTDAVANGGVVVCNISRSVVDHARKRFSLVRVVLVTAPREELHARLLARGREEREDLSRRLERDSSESNLPPDLTITNVGPVESNVEILVNFLSSTAKENYIPVGVFARF